MPTSEAIGVVQAVDVPGRELTVRVNGVSTIFDIAVDCAIVLRGERVKLRLVQPSDAAHVIYHRTPEGLWAQVVVVNSCFASKK